MRVLPGDRAPPPCGPSPVGGGMARTLWERDGREWTATLNPPPKLWLSLRTSNGSIVVRGLGTTAG